MHARPRRGSERGLTLLEVMLAATLMSLVFISIYGIVWSTLATRDAIESNTLPLTIGPAVMDTITGDIRNALVEPYDDLDAFTAEEETVAGESVTNMNFVTAVASKTRFEVDDEMVRSYVTEVGYRMRRSEYRRSLGALYRREDFAVDDKPLEGGKYYKLVDGVRIFKVDFFDEDPGRQPTDEDLEGVPEWDAKKEGRLPWACRVTLVIEAKGETDDRGVLLEEPREFKFVQYIVFPTRHDPVESASN